MTREQAISYLASSGMTDEQIAEIVTAIERTETNDKGFTCPENRKCMCFQCDSKGCEHWTAEIPNIPTYNMNRELVETPDKRTETHPCDYGKKETHGDVIFKSEGQFYSGRIANDEHKAVEILNQFTKAFCIDVSVMDDLAFRCSECPFEIPDATCLVKKFKRKFAPDYKDFGSMGSW